MQTRKRLTGQQLAVWRSLVETTEELRRRLGAQLAADSNLSSGDYAVLLALSEAPGRSLRSSELAEVIGWERSRLSHHLGRMERRRLIRRTPSVTDNRGAEVLLADEGADVFRGSTAPHLRAIQHHFADALSPEQFEALGDILRTVNDHLQETKRA